MRSSSDSRPTKLVTGAGRFVRRVGLRLQHRHVRLLKLGRRRDAELVGELLADALVGGERVGLAPGGEQRGDQAGGQPLVKRVLGGERLQLRDVTGVDRAR